MRKTNKNLIYIVMIYGIFFFLIFLLAIWRRSHVHYAHIKYRHALYELRDELRLKAIKGEIDSNHWLFNYYDKTISGLVANTYFITLFFFMGVAFIHAKDHKLPNFRVDLEKDINKNPYYKDLDARISKASACLINEQHYISINFILLPVLRPIMKGISLFVKGKNELGKITSVPEITNKNHLAY